MSSSDSFEPLSWTLGRRGLTEDDALVHVRFSFSWCRQAFVQRPLRLIELRAVPVALGTKPANWRSPVPPSNVTKATTEADCTKADGTWDAATKKCSEKKM
jgi:hypothetical protein